MNTSNEWQIEHHEAAEYERVLVGAISGPFARALVAASKLTEGASVLDVGCGTGVVARLAAGRVGSSGRVVGVDVNTSMIEVARSVADDEGAEVEWRVGSAQALPFSRGSFDVVVCGHALQFFEDRGAALREMARVLGKGGRVCVSVWRGFAFNPYLHALWKAIGDSAGEEAAKGLGAAISLSDPAKLRHFLEGAGFGSVEVGGIALALALPRLEEFVNGHIDATPLRGVLAGAGEGVRREIVESVSRQLVCYCRGEALQVPFASHVAIGRL